MRTVAHQLFAENGFDAVTIADIAPGRRRGADGVQPLRDEGAYTEVVRSSPALAAYEQRGLLEAERELTAALADAWTTDPEPGMATSPVLFCPRLAAPLAAALRLTVSRVVVVQQRQVVDHSDDPDGAAAEVRTLTDSLMTGLYAPLGLQPPANVAKLGRRAG